MAFFCYMLLSRAGNLDMAIVADSPLTVTGNVVGYDVHHGRVVYCYCQRQLLPIDIPLLLTVMQACQTVTTA